jgi:hypothetical protein
MSSDADSDTIGISTRRQTSAPTADGRNASPRLRFSSTDLALPPLPLVTPEMFADDPRYTSRPSIFNTYEFGNVRDWKAVASCKAVNLRRIVAHINEKEKATSMMMKPLSTLSLHRRVVWGNEPPGDSVRSLGPAGGRPRKGIDNNSGANCFTIRR